MSKELTLTDREELFINILFETGGDARKAAELAGYADVNYGYVLRKRLAKEIAAATKDYLTFSSPRAAHKLVSLMDEENPNPVHLNTLRDILDRTGVKHIEEQIQPTIKANIFILPEKQYKTIDQDGNESY